MQVWHVYLVRGMRPVNGVIQLAGQLVAAQRRLGLEARLLVLAQTPEDVAVVDDARAALECFPDVLVADRWWRSMRSDGYRPDLLHFHEVLRPPHRLLATRFPEVPYVVSTHGGLVSANLARFRWKKAPYGWLIERRFLGGAAALIAGNPREARDCRAYFGPRSATPPVVVVENALDAAALEPPGWSVTTTVGAEGRPRLVTLCRYDVRQKGLDTLASIAAHLPEVDVVVHGEQCRNEPERIDELRRWAPPTFRLAPPVFGVDKRRALLSADLFVQPSRWEGLSAALMEAMAAGVPCAVSEPIAEALPFREQDLGLVLDPNPGLAAAQVRSALADRERLAQWGAAARRFAQQRFAPASVARRTVDVYRQAVPVPVGVS